MFVALTRWQKRRIDCNPPSALLVWRLAILALWTTPATAPDCLSWCLQATTAKEEYAFYAAEYAAQQQQQHPDGTGQPQGQQQQPQHVGDAGECSDTAGCEEAQAEELPQVRTQGGEQSTCFAFSRPDLDAVSHKEWGWWSGASMDSAVHLCCPSGG